MCRCNLRRLCSVVRFVSVAVLLTGFYPPASAQIIDWNNPAGGTYDTPGNWSPANVPNTAFETARFNLPNSYTVNLPLSARTVDDLLIEDGSVSYGVNLLNATYNVTDELVVAGGDFAVGTVGTGNVVMTANTVRVHDSSNFVVGGGSPLSVTDTLFIGDFPSDTFGMMTVQGGSTLDLASTDLVALSIGANGSTTGGVSTLGITGTGTMLQSDIFGLDIVVGSTGRGRLEITNGAVAELPLATIYIGSSNEALNSSLLISDGASLSSFDSDTNTTGITRIGEGTFVSADVEILSGGQFNSGLTRVSGNSSVVIDGANSRLDATSFDVFDRSSVSVQNQGLLRMLGGGGDDLEDGSTLTVSGPGSVIEANTGLVVESSLATVPSRLNVLNGGIIIPAADIAADFSMELYMRDNSILTIDGAGSLFNAADASVFLSTGSPDATPQVFVTDGGTLQAFNLNAEDALITAEQGTLNIERDAQIGGRLVGNLVDDLGTAKLDLLSGSVLEVGRNLIVGSQSELNIAGGTIVVSTLADIHTSGDSPLRWQNGVVEVTGDSQLPASVATVLMPEGELGFGRRLEVEGELGLVTPLVVDGGELSVLGLTGEQLLQIKSGRFEYLDNDLVIGPGGPLGSEFDLREGITLFSDQDVLVEGTLIAGGRVASPLNNNSSGVIRVEQNKRLVADSLLFNAGQIQLQGGRIDVGTQFTNSAIGNLVGRGTLDAAGGTTNNGDIALSNGQTDVFGDVTNQGSGRIIVSGNADVTFWDDVTHTGAAFHVSSGSSATFFGNAGFSITGGGDVFFEADITPGSSPGLETFGGDVYFGALSTLEIEIAGTTPGHDFDRIEVQGVAHLGGTLKVELIDNGAGVYNPVLGDSFGFLASQGGAGGVFDTLDLPELDPGLAWMLNPGGVTVSLNVVAALEGDYNFDGVVDAADYTAWRDALGQTGTGLAADGDLSGVVDEGDYLLWQANFGASLPASLQSDASQVPEPSSALVLGMLMLAASCKRAILHGLALS